MNKILLIMMSMTIFSCAPAEKSGDVTLRFSWWGGDIRHKGYLKAIELFEEKNPSIKIKAEYSGWDGHYDRLITQVVGDVAPDIMQVDWNWLFALGSDKFYDMSTLKEIDFSGYEQSAIENVRINDKLLAIPYGDGFIVYLYNKTMYDKVGLPIPKSYADLRNAVKVFKEKLGEGYYPLTGDLFGQARYYVEQKYGVAFITGKKVNYTEDQLTEGLEFALSLQDDGVMPTAQSAASEGIFDITQHPRWSKGLYTGTLAWAGGLDTLQSSVGDMELVVGEYPRGLGEYPAAHVRSLPVFAINAKTKYPEEAAKFLNFFVNDPEANKAINTTMGLPGNTKAMTVLKEANIIQEKNLGVMAAERLKGNRGSAVSPYFEHAEPMGKTYDLNEKLSYKLITPREAAQGIIKAYNDYLSKQ